MHGEEGKLVIYRGQFLLTMIFLRVGGKGERAGLSFCFYFNLSTIVLTLLKMLLVRESDISLAAVPVSFGFYIRSYLKLACV